MSVSPRRRETAPMSPREKTFDAQRDRLFGIAYRMLGTVADAEDVVQETWLRWRQHDGPPPDNPGAWLTRVTTNLSIDALRRARRAREHYPGPWLPEPLSIAPAADGESLAALSESLSIALLAVLETLSPNERAVFVLREAFDMSHADIAASLGAEPATCRQWLKRARDRLRGARPAERDERADRALLERFLGALAANDVQALLNVLHEDVVLVSDGGGKVAAATRPLSGARAVSRFLAGIAARRRDETEVEVVRVNGDWGLLVRHAGQPDSSLVLRRDGERVGAVYIQRNPDKLRSLT